MDESALVDGCAFAFWRYRHVMWPGVITTGLFNFLLACDFTVTAMLQRKTKTIIPAINSFLGTTFRSKAR